MDQTVKFTPLDMQTWPRGQMFYYCVIRDSGQLQVNYKIYGKEFDLSCTKEEFEENFVLINKKTGVRK